MQRTKIILPVAFVTTILILNLNGIASAADNNSAINEITAGLAGGGAGFGTTFQTQLSNLSKGLLASAKIIAVIMTAAAGCMVCFGIQDGKKTFWNWILGIGLAINFGDLILNLWDVQDVSSPTKIDDYKLLLKSEDDPSIDILSPFMRYYISVIMSGAAVIAPYAINLTLLLAIIDGAIKVSFDLISGDKIKFLVTMILKVGFFIFLIQSWVGTNSSYQLMSALSSGFETMGYTAGGAGKDIFVYSYGRDIITDYVVGTDKIKIEDGKVFDYRVIGADVILYTDNGSVRVKNGKDKKITVQMQTATRLQKLIKQQKLQQYRRIQFLPEFLSRVQF